LNPPSTRRCVTPSGLAEAGIASSVGSRGDPYDYALVESTIGLFKTEVIHLKGPWVIGKPSNSAR